MEIPWALLQYRWETCHSLCHFGHAVDHKTCVHGAVIMHGLATMPKLDTYVRWYELCHAGLRAFGVLARLEGMYFPHTCVITCPGGPISFFCVAITMGCLTDVCIFTVFLNVSGVALECHHGLARMCVILDN